MNYSEHLRRIYFLKLDIENTPVYVNSSGQSLYWDYNNSGSNTEFLGVGALGEISGLGENTDMSASQITVGLSGIPIENIHDIQSNNYQERKVLVWQNDLTSNYQVESSQLVWSGRMDTADIDIGSTAKISMRCESALARWNRPAPRRMNNQQQQILHLGDKGLEYVSALNNVNLVL